MIVSCNASHFCSVGISVTSHVVTISLLITTERTHSDQSMWDTTCSRAFHTFRSFMWRYSPLPGSFWIQNHPNKENIQHSTYSEWFLSSQWNKLNPSVSFYQPVTSCWVKQLLLSLNIQKQPSSEWWWLKSNTTVSLSELQLFCKQVRRSVNNTRPNWKLISSRSTFRLSGR